MALIKCPECGQMISDKSNACIHCGFPLNSVGNSPAEQDILVKVHRKSKFWGCAIGTAIYIDGVHQLTIKNGDIGTFKIKSGIHTLTIGKCPNENAFTVMADETRQINIDSNNQVYIEFQVGISGVKILKINFEEV